MKSKPKLLLHACCGTCSCRLPEILSEDFEVTVYYINPNIHPPKEYLQRLEDTKKVVKLQAVELIEADYVPREWFDYVRGHEHEPEGGRRCELCFEFRLWKTAVYAKANGYDAFTTALTMGRNKKASIINPIGERLAGTYGIPFISRDFKKNGGLDAAVKRMDELGIRRQDYCGCVYSKKETYARRALRREQKNQREHVPH